MASPEAAAESKPEPRRPLMAALASLLLVATWALGPFLAAGTFRWTTCYAYLGALVAGLLAHQLYVARRNQELLERRRRIGRGTPPWDLVWNLAFWPLMISVPVVAGLGVRFGWASLPAALWPLGAAALAFGLALSAWAMAVNPHFEGTVRIQKELGHRVVDTGPYRVIRHPGYAGLALWALATPLLVLSAPAFAPALAVCLWIVLRTALEDRFLCRELAGYADYARRVRFRLIPFLF